GPEEVPAVDLREVLDPVPGRYREVDRLAARVRERVERGARQLDDVALEHAPLGHAQDCRTWPQPPALSLLLDQSAALERTHQPRRRALGNAARACKRAQRHGLVGLEYADEQFRTPV